MAADVIWGGLLLAGLVYEVVAIRNAQDGDTLSERIRAWFRVRTHPGRVAFALVWTVFTAWFLAHILT